MAVFLPIVQSFLPRILNAAAPPGGVARENRKQCLKVNVLHNLCNGSHTKCDIGITYYLELRNALRVYCTSHHLTTKVKLVV